MPIPAVPAAPTIGPTPLLTDGGLETTLVFHDRRDLPAFAAFPLLEDADGRARLRSYYEDYLAVARHHGTGFVLETPTWRANPDWGAELGYEVPHLLDLNRLAVAEMADLRDRAALVGPVLISLNIGPRGDGYVPGALMSQAEAEEYHSVQVSAAVGTAADVVTALTLTYVDEAVGLVRAATAHGLPAVVSFTVETDGRLASGPSLADAVDAVDAATGSAAAWFMVNCAHPQHLAPAVSAGWPSRVRGMRANASTASHAELDEATELDAGDPDDLAEQYRLARSAHPDLLVLGGCCGTDVRHVAAIAEACVPVG